MQIDKKNINVLLALWIESDPRLWGHLRDIQIKFLYERLIKEKSFKEIATKHNLEEKKVRRCFFATLLHIEKILGKEVSKQLRYLNRQLDKRPTTQFGSDFTVIFKN